MWPFNKKVEVEETTFHFYDDENTPPTAVGPRDWKVELSLPVHKIAALFLSEGWATALPDTETYPTPQQVMAMLMEIIQQFQGDDELDIFQATRLIGLKDPDFPQNVDFYLYLGTAEPIHGEEPTLV